MRLGLFMMPLHPSHRAIADCYDRDIDQLVLADKLGFDEAWLGEHFTEKWENAPSPNLCVRQLSGAAHPAAISGPQQRPLPQPRTVFQRTRTSE